MEEPGLTRYLSEMVVRYPRMQAAGTYPGGQYDQLFQADYIHQEDDDTCTNCSQVHMMSRSIRSDSVPGVHYGLIASGNQVMRDGMTREKLRQELNVLCFEMEAAGLMDDFPCLVIRGICDYADTHKNKRWQPYAAAVAAAYAKELLCFIPANQVVRTRPIGETSLLASVLQDQGKYEAAEKLYRRDLEGSEKVLGVEYPNILTSVSNLALVLQNQGKYKVAKEINRRALEASNKVLGVEHLSTLNSVYCHAYLFHTQQRFDDASILYFRASAGFLKAWGPEHPTTQNCSRH